MFTNIYTVEEAKLAFPNGAQDAGSRRKMQKEAEYFWGNNCGKSEVMIRDLRRIYFRIGLSRSSVAPD